MVVVLALSFDLSGQCDTGSEPECACDTAPVLCTVDSLDNYSFSMSDYQHPWDGPDPLCPGPGNGSSVPNNPTWFAFVAWCEELTINVHPTDCMPFSGGVNGVQVAIYSDCNYTPVVCNVMAGDCNTDDKELVMTDLTIGNTYYFLIDGCLGAYCDVEIDVIGTCGDAVIADWTEPVDGPTEVCAGTSPEFSVESLDGATDYHWYIDGVLIQEGTELITLAELWDTPGVYEICVDASNDPCIPESDPPAPNCITIEVFAAEAGDIMANPNPVCPNDTIYLTASGYNQDPGYNQYIVVTDDNGTIVAVFAGDNGAFTHDMCASFTAYSYNYHNTSSTGAPIVGDNISSLDCGDGCCDLEMIPIDFVDDEDPVLIAPPGDLDLACIDELQPAQPLQWTDNCDGSGTVDPIETGQADLCDGGTITREWEYTDQCGNTAMHQQTITIGAAPEPVMDPAPADVTVVCADIPTSAPPLNYSNGASGLCEISGSVDPVMTGSADLCGGSITFTWELTDTCGHTISDMQVVTVDPVPEAQFTSLPADTTISCDAIPSSHPSLTYTNGLTGACEISGTVAPTVTNTANECGGQIVRTWEFTDACNRAQSHSQTITVDPAPEAVWIDPPADTTYACNDLPANPPPLAYSNSGTGNCLIQGSVDATILQNDPCAGVAVWQWTFTDNCNRTITHTQNITILPAPPAMFINPPADTTVACGQVPAPVPNLAYSNGITGACELSGSVTGVQAGNPDYCGGVVTRTWTFTDPCGNQIQHVQNITVEPAPPAVFTSLPVDITVECADVNSIPNSLSYTNNQAGTCQIAGTAVATTNGSYNSCGGSIQLVWTFTDNCNRTITHTQGVTVLPAPGASFTNPPTDATVSCADVPAIPPSLNYSNGTSGLCAITGSVPGIPVGNYDECGGSIEYTWTHTDPCGNTITHSQTLTIEPAPDPQWIDPPDDITLGCDDIYLPPHPLLYSNDLSNPCLISGSAIAEVIVDGLMTTHIWSFTHPCSGALVEHTQVVEQVPPVEAFIDPDVVTICAGETYNLDLITVEDISGQVLTITYHSGSPANIANELPSGLVSPDDYTEYILLATNEYGCSEELLFTIVVEANPNAGEDHTFDACLTDAVDLTGYLTPGSSTDGYWLDLDGSGADLSDPTHATFSDVIPGTYTLLYIVEDDLCPSDTAEFLVTINGEPEFTIDTIFCTSGNSSYTVVIEGTLLDVSASAGDVIHVSASVIEIQNIPIDHTLNFEIWDTGPFCSYFFTVNPPNCDCPGVAPPSNDGDQTICFGEPTPDLSVSVAAGNLVNWYDMPAGGTLLAANSTTLSPTETLPGVYIYYAEAESIDFPGCVSSVRTPVTLRILELPVANDILIELCDTVPGEFLLDLTDWNLQITNDPAAVVTFHTTAADAQSGNSPLAIPITLDAGTTQLFARVENVNGCVNVSAVDILLNQLPQYSIVATDENCAGDHSGIIEITGLDLTNHTVTFDGSTFADTYVFDSLTTGSYELAVTSDITGCTHYDTISIAPGIDIDLEITSVNCNNNGTEFDPSDDFYTITVVASHSSGSGTYELMVNGATEGQFSYDAAVELTLPATNTAIEFLIEDIAAGCRDSIITPVLVPCSNQCLLTLSDTSAVCNDGGTPQDPGDDTYTISFTVTAVQGAADQMYTIAVDGTPVGNGTYGMTEQLVLPADGSMPWLQFVDHDDPACSASWQLSPLEHCSNDCALDIILGEIYCDNAGTNQTEDDDVFYAVVTITGTNISGGWITSDGLFEGVIGDTDTIGPYLILDGDAVVTFTATDGDCEEMITLAAPAACSSCDQTMDAGADEFIDCGNPSVTLTMTASEFADFEWTDPLGASTPGQSIDASIAGVYIGTAVFADGCVLIDSVTVIADDILPTVWGGPDETFNCIVFEAVLEATVITGSGPFDFEWTDISGNVLSTTSQLTVDAPGQYFVRIYDQGVDCWSATDAVLVTDATNTISAAIYANPGDVISCTIQSVILSHDNEPDVEYTWIAAGTPYFTPTIEVFEEGVIYLEAIDTITFCSATDSIEITDSQDYPIIVIEPIDTLSCDDLVVTLDASSSVPSAGGEFIWTSIAGDTIGTTAMVTVDAAGYYVLYLNDPFNGCFGRDTVEVVSEAVFPAIIPMPDIQLDCDITGDVITLEINEPPSSVEVDWETVGGMITGQDFNEIEFVGAGQYIAHVRDIGTGCVISDTAIVTQFEPPTALIASTSATACDVAANGALIIHEVQGGNGPFTYEIDGNITSEDTIDNLLPGEYVLTATDINLCTYDTVIVIESGDGFSVDLEALITISQGDEYELTASVNIPPDEIAQVSWAPPAYLSCDTCLVTTAIGAEDILYTVAVTDVHGCSASASVEVRVTEERNVYIPNTFTPSNNDGVNDYFTAYTNQADALIASLEIFDRWGNTIFATEQIPPGVPSAGWDGTYNGQPLNPAVFVYKVTMQFIDGTTGVYHGDVTLIR